MTEFFSIAGGIIAVVFLFFLAIMVHEYGHFAVAKRLGFRIDAFSICFGPAIWKKVVNGIEYRLGCIPLGGYVALPQLDPAAMDKIQGGNEDRESLTPVSAWKRILVAVAGPGGNIVLAVLLALIIGAFAPSSDFGGQSTIIGNVDGERAIASGICAGDEIVAIAGRPVSFWSDVTMECHLAGDTVAGVAATIRRNGKTFDLTLPVVVSDSGIVKLDGIFPRHICEVAAITSSSPASRSPLKDGDRVAEINGVSVYSPEQAVELVRNAGTNAVSITAIRNATRANASQTIVATIHPEYNAQLDRPAIGILFADPSSSIPQWMTYRSPVKQIASDAGSIFRMLRALFTPKSKSEQKRAASGMGGPGTLLFILWNEVHSGLFRSMGFLRFLCINLAILNLLPIPVLDGGHILFALVEIVTRRKPSRKFVEYVTNAFAILLIGLMLLMLVRDTIRIHDFLSR